MPLNQFNIPKSNLYNEVFQKTAGDAGIIRNKLKVGAAIHNAQEIIKIPKSIDGSDNGFKCIQAISQHFLEWQKIFKKQGFKFTG